MMLNELIFTFGTGIYLFLSLLGEALCFLQLRHLHGKGGLMWIDVDCDGVRHGDGEVHREVHAVSICESQPATARCTEEVKAALWSDIDIVLAVVRCGKAVGSR